MALESGTRASDSAPDSTAPAANVDAEDPALVVVADGRGSALNRTVLARYGVGAGDQDLGLDDCSECDPPYPALPILTGPDIGDVIVADVRNARWQIIRDGSWETVPFDVGQRIGGAVIQGTDGYIYVVNDADDSIRIDAISSFDLSWAATYPVPEGEAGPLRQANDDILFGDSVIVAVQSRPDLPRWDFEIGTNRLTLSIADHAQGFELPPNWTLNRGSISRIDDGTVVAHATVVDADERFDSILLRFWIDGSYATGTIPTEPVNGEAYGRITETGWVQIDEAISLYPFPSYGGADPLAGWAARPLIAPDVETVPRLLPANSIDAVPGLFRYDGASGEPTTAERYVQIWARADEDGTVTGLVAIHTGFVSTPLNPASTRVEVPDWPVARSNRMGSDGFANILLRHANRSVSVWSKGLGESETIRLARRLSIQRDGAGWAPPFDSGEAWISISEGWEGVHHPGRGLSGVNSAGTRIEISMDRYVPSAALTPLSVDRPITLVRVDGRPALLFDRGDIVALTYTRSDGITVVVGLESTADELVSLASSLVEVDQATWESSTSLNPSSEDGCNSFFC